MRTAPTLLLALVVLAGCRSSEPEVRKGPPLDTTFAPPPGLHQTEHFLQRRQARAEFREQEPMQVVDMVGGATREEYEPLPQGGWRVTATVIDEESSRDGVTTQPPLSLAGVPFVHVVDQKGAYVRAERIDETLQALRERITDPRARKMIEPLLTPEFLTQRLEKGWNQRFAKVCNRPLAPGASFLFLDEQELPAGGPARSLVEERVLGATQVNGGPAVEFALVYGGGRSKIAESPGGQAFLHEPEIAGTALTEYLEGRGSRLLAQGSCQTAREVGHLEGRLEQHPPPGHEAPTFPLRIDFTVDREVWRTW